MRPYPSKVIRALGFGSLPLMLVYGFALSFGFRGQLLIWMFAIASVGCLLYLSSMVRCYAHPECADLTLGEKLQECALNFSALVAGIWTSIAHFAQLVEPRILLLG